MMEHCVDVGVVYSMQGVFVSYFLVIQEGGTDLRREVQQQTQQIEYR